MRAREDASALISCGDTVAESAGLMTFRGGIRGLDPSGFHFFNFS